MIMSMNLTVIESDQIYIDRVLRLQTTQVRQIRTRLNITLCDRRTRTIPLYQSEKPAKNLRSVLNAKQSTNSWIRNCYDPYHHS